MSVYTINYSDFYNKSPIIINTGTIDYSTSVGLVGRNASNFGQTIAENFLHLLENFASPVPPENPIEGQLWYDTSDPENKKLMINDGAISGYTWYPANGVHQSDIAPTNIRNGDIWIDTTAQQLKFYNGVGWTLVGPSYSSSLQTGSYPEVIQGTDAQNHYVIKQYADGDVVSIIAKESFKPTLVIEGFDNLVPGINLSTKSFNSVVPVFNGVASEASSLRVTTPINEKVSANYVMRKDIPQSLNESLTINNNSGLRVGLTSSTFSIQKSGNDGVITSSQNDSKILFKIFKDSVSNTIMSIDGYTKRVGINVINPSADLEIDGTLKVSSSTIISNNISISGNSIVSGSSSISGNLTVQNTLTSNGPIVVGKIGDTQNTAIVPVTTSTYDIGSPQFPFRTIWADNIGTTSTYFNVRALSATRLSTTTQFGITGQVETISSVVFDGNFGGTSKTFTTRLTETAISGQTLIGSASTSTMMIVSSGGALRKISKGDFSADITPIGSITAWGGGSAPTGWLLCNGSSVSTSTYNSLYTVIGTTYGSVDPDHFNVPDITPLTATGPVSVYYIIKY